MLLSLTYNSKLLGGVTFDLPPVITCPGRSALCERLCYATEGNFRLPGVARRRKKLLNYFEETGEIPDIDPKADPLFVRFFVSGDFYNVRLVKAVQRFARKYEHTLIMAFTRSWRVEELVPHLKELADMPNFQLWLSADEETGLPRLRWSRVAYMAVNDKTPRQQVDLVFRAFSGSESGPDGHNRSNPSGAARKRAERPRLWLNGPVCLAQRGLKGLPHKCAACRNCFTERKNGNSRIRI